MKRSLFGGHRRLLFRSYLILVVGLLAVAVVLERGFDYLQSRQAPQSDPWLDATLQIIEARLAAVPAAERSRVAATLSESTGLVIQLLENDEVVNAASVTLDTLVDDDGNTWHLYAPDSIDELIYIGPVAEPHTSSVVTLVPPLFYLSIFVLVGLWLRPLLTDIDRITAGANRFAADYREPSSTASETTQLTSLAQNIDDMSARLSGLIQSQKELIAALSHEMRTPLARIRFALAVMDDKSDEQLAARLEALNADVQEIDDLIAAMLDYARLDHPDLEMHWQQVPVEPWLRQITEKFERPDVAIASNLGTADTLDMDPRLMTLAVSNLLANASRYAKADIRVNIRNVGEHAEICVEDDGEGVPDGKRDSIFKAFTRLDDSRNRETGGYGLGLAVVARIAALHGGSAAIEDSAELGGASFSIRW